ncbi:MAG: LysR substrate-binding domain-containing protein [Pseudomonadota bacterium]
MRFRIPPLSTLRLFEAAGRARSFSDAAKEVGVTASAVSHAIQSLEDWLGAALFARKRGMLRLTPAGVEYHAQVHAALALLSTSAPRRPSHADRLRLTVVPTFAERLLAPRLHEFMGRYPELSLSIDTSHTLAKFPGDGFDAGIRLGTGPWPDLYVRHILTETMVPVCAPGFVAPGFDAGSISDRQMISVTTTDDGWADWCAANGRPAPDPDRGLRVDTMQMALVAASQGMGIALARLPSAAADIEDGTLVMLNSCPVPCRQAYWFVTAMNADPQPIIEALFGWLQDEMERLQAAAEKSA